MRRRARLVHAAHSCATAARRPTGECRSLGLGPPTGSSAFPSSYAYARPGCASLSPKQQQSSLEKGDEEKSLLRNGRRLSLIQRHLPDERFHSDEVNRSPDSCRRPLNRRSEGCFKGIALKTIEYLLGATSAPCYLSDQNAPALFRHRERSERSPGRFDTLFKRRLYLGCAHSFPRVGK